MKDVGAPVTAESLLGAYMQGVFPMAETRDDPDLFWVEPRWRGVLPLDRFRLSRSTIKQMRRATRTGSVTTSLDLDFEGVLAGCAARDETWISGRLIDLYRQLFAAGFAHSQEVWRGDRMIGGVYGVAIGGAFFGESMFSSETGGSKIALAVLVHRLRRAGYALFDTQFVTSHLLSLGAEEIRQDDYRRRLGAALALRPDRLGPEPSLEEVLQDMVQRRTQTS
ncbi:leucyl/phenylalanyl-tRNA--protein transferase [Hasllibacter halocynthiae]|uniref:Leucyl/phenylalanyl-tRNA--protein transferase n=1 Tax=Hasllibacter halocynthiae TaxID=595589 RepID=A0A2T0X7F0_9RHOB|nr:leucyl/phenylalanyl-tRNA--protein transferase [Hasllibacter halocynthiae]PRY94853.1 leucyl/phenylalanyl-tRNA--protein transferase [Hasllibacter halocynthiae]